MRRQLATVFLGAALAAAGARAAAAEEILVFAAVSLTDALQEAATAYEKAGGDKVLLNLAASSILERQIQEGAPADLFFSADEAKMDELEQRRLLLTGTRRSLLSNALVIVVPAGSSLKIDSPRDLASAKVRALALAEPQTVPAGIYAREYLRARGLWSQVADKVIPTESVRAALAAVASGNVEAGIVYKTDAAISQKVRIAYEVPRADGPKISYPVAVIAGSKHREAARRFLAYLQSPAALEVFRKYGFLTMEPAAAAPATARCDVHPSSVLSRSPDGAAQVSNLDLILVKAIVPKRPPVAPGETRKALQPQVAVYQVSADGKRSKVPSATNVHGGEGAVGGEDILFWLDVPIDTAERDEAARRYMADSGMSPSLQAMGPAAFAGIFRQHRVGKFQVECLVFDQGRLMGAGHFDMEVLFKGNFFDQDAFRKP
jgi:molybdate transport system substrate-binding protein